MVRTEIAVVCPRIAVLLFALSLCDTARGQKLQVTDATTAPFTAENLISNVFLGEGVEVKSITFDGEPVSVGFFTDGTTAVGLQRGIVMTTGLVETTGGTGCAERGQDFASNSLKGLIPPPQSDPDLGPISSAPLYDVTRYTITFIPISDTLRFRYCFASEEYPEFACSNYNDIFGFFIQGPGYPSPTNIAKIPGTGLPVTINNIHPDNSTPSLSCPPKNANYYTNNNNSSKAPTYDGLTHVFTAEAVVVPCQTYTIKLAIADAGDAYFDSGVFLEAKSFGTGALRTSVATPSLDGTVAEGCGAASITFRLPNPAVQDFPIDYKLLGTATNGVDYQLIPNNLFIPAGQQEITIPIIGLEDNTAETGEYLAFDVRRDPCNRDTILIFVRDNPILPPNLLKDTSLCLGDPAIQLNGTLPITLPPPPSFSQPQDLSITPEKTTVSSTVNVSGVLPTTLQPGMIQSVCLNVTHPWVDDLDVFLTSPGGQYLELMTDCGFAGKNFVNTCFTPVATKKINQAIALDAPFTGNWLPEGPWSDLWGGAFPTNGQWKLQLRDDQTGFIGTLHDWTITFKSLYEVNYQWSPAAGLSCADCPAPLASPSATTQYTLHAVDSYGCSLDQSVNVAVAQALQAPVVNCDTYTNNSITFVWQPVPGASDYEINVDGTGWITPSGNNSHVVGNLQPNATVTIQVRATGGGISNFCEAKIGTSTCSNCSQPSVSKTETAEVCAGSGDGSVTLTPDGANPPYQFTLGTQSNSTGIFNNLAAGNYFATVTDVSGCQTFVPVEVKVGNTLVVNILGKNVTCFDGDDGAATAIVSGGVGILSYNWSDPSNQMGATAVNLKAGTYTVTVSDTDGCTGTASVTLSQPPDILLSVTASLAKCFGDSTGSAKVTVQGGVGTLQYAWSNGQTGSMAVNLPAGSYLVTVTDAIGCAKTSFALVGQPLQLMATMQATPTTCANLNNGTATVTASGGTGALAYKWSDPSGQATKTASGLAAGIYTVTITDKNNCTLTQTATITAPSAIQLSSAGANVDCSGGSNGSATATASGGTGTLTYKWSDPAAQSTPTATGLKAGNYTVTVTDANGCTATSSVAITQPQVLAVNLTAQPVLCFGQTTGSITLNVQGGTQNYQYVWSSTETTQNISNKAAGTYTVTVTDAKGCTAVSSSSISQPSDLAVSVGGTQNILCFGAQTGSIQLNISGGTGAASVTWSGPGGFSGTGALISGLAAGAYSATITDAAGCSKTQAVSLNQPASALSLSFAAADTICFGAADGTATVAAGGGTAPYIYFWDAGGQATPTATALAAGTYTVTVTDANNCTSTGSATVFQKGQLSVVAQGGVVGCSGSSAGTAQVTQISYGGTPASLNNFVYLWSSTPPQSGSQISGLQAGQTYTVTVTDALGCSATQTVSVPNVPVVGAAIGSLLNPSCFNSSNGSATANGSGGVLPYTYTWSSNVPTSTGPLAQNLGAGTYFVTVTDAKGCTGTSSATLGQPSAVTLDFQSTMVGCFGESTGGAEVSAGGGSPPYQYLWNTGASGSQIQNVPAAVYFATVTDAKGCTQTGQVEVTQSGSALGGTTTHRDNTCFGAVSGQIKINATGGAPPYRYALDNGPYNGSSVRIGLAAGVYVPQIIDANGCTATLPAVEVKQLDPIEVELGPDITVELGQSTQLLAQLSNASGPVQYAWTPADSLWLSCLDCPDPFVDSLRLENWFEVQVTDTFGCTASDRVLVVVFRPRKVFVPEGFSPNGDLNNDLLQTHGQDGTRVLTFQVFDRWGEKLYEAGNFNLNDPLGWDGNFRGQPMNPGVYVWLLEVEYIDGVRQVFRGNTTLIR